MWSICKEELQCTSNEVGGESREMVSHSLGEEIISREGSGQLSQMLLTDGVKLGLRTNPGLGAASGH